MKLIVGLGNPGIEYAKTRHNIGFMIVDDFVDREKLGIRAYDNKRKGEMFEANIDGLSKGQINQKIFFLKPMEFMNRSGGAVGALVNFYKIDSKDILVIHDDIDLPMSKIQLKLGGSSGGHNGLKDIIAVLDTPNFRRLRVGIGRPADQNDVADYVLHPFTQEEKNLIDDKSNEIQKYIHEFLEK
ncbi:MAG: aminoacyl-tRNA hydrolase [candidate division SR1 bacterium]|nr:aminoacyl-tRNA hydrolase [candidate division SR1 bacterium]